MCAWLMPKRQRSICLFTFSLLPGTHANDHLGLFSLGSSARHDVVTVHPRVSIGSSTNSCTQPSKVLLSVGAWNEVPTFESQPAPSRIDYIMFEKYSSVMLPDAITFQAASSTST